MVERDDRVTGTLVLVHGGTLTSTMWDPVLAYLRTPTVTVDLPGRRYRPADLGTVTRHDWVQAVVDEVTRLETDQVVLVGHSSAGYVLPGAGAALPGLVTHLVFVAATVPADGRAPVEYLKPRLRELAESTEELVRSMAAGKTLGGLRPGEPPIDTHLEVVENGPRMGLEAPGPLFEPYEGWARVPPSLRRTYVRCRQDRVVTAELTERMLGHMGEVTTIDIDAGHGVADEAPAELARLLDQLVHTG